MVVLLFVVLAAPLACTRREAPAPPRPLRVAAASDLAVAFAEIGKDFEAETGRRVEFSFGSTGLLAKQIARGAPFDVFAAANESSVDEVVKSGACSAETRVAYAEGRLALYCGGRFPVHGLRGLVDPAFRKIGLANPEHAPYGRAAREALVKEGIYEAVKGKLVFGENVQQALQFAQTGNADCAVVALSLVAGRAEGRFVPVAPELHSPLIQTMALCGGGAGGTDREISRRFLAFVSGPRGHAALWRRGFVLPADRGEK